ncbi:MAG: carboxylesterase family protein, partial [Prolixibacteraceae bacterium]|nr:carboxylesterase family protein [Prolixibacteraceae bacterium]
MKTLFILTLTTILFQGFVKGDDGKSTNLQTEIPVVKSDSTYKVLVKHDIVYAKGLSHESINSANATTIPLKLDVYEPDNNVKNRPVFMFVHGGGFVGGSKKQAQIFEWANYYTSRGWVFISIDYRLKRDKGTVPQQWADYTKKLPENARVAQFLAIYPAQRDAKAALR